MGNFSVGGVQLDTDEFGAYVKEFDFSDHSSNIDYVITANVSLISLVAIFVGLRIFVRSYFLRRLFLDDGVSPYYLTA
jgi:hypothetical protein